MMEGKEESAMMGKKEGEVMMEKGEAMMEKSIVTYSSAGFSPNSLTVKVGTTVTFKNGGSEPMWIASAFHPIHRELPGFDQLKSVGNGGTYEYTFDKAGTWKYHNHLNPGHGGSVTVQ